MHHSLYTQHRVCLEAMVIAHLRCNALYKAWSFLLDVYKASIMLSTNYSVLRCTMLSSITEDKVSFYSCRSQWGCRLFGGHFLLCWAHHGADESCSPGKFSSTRVEGIRHCLALDQATASGQCSCQSCKRALLPASKQPDCRCCSRKLEKE